MCDKGILEYNPDSMKLEYCIEITGEIQRKIEEGISKLIGEPVFISEPKSGQYPNDRPEHSRNRIVIEPLNKEGKKFYEREVCVFSLEQLPGCCGVLISYHVNVRLPYQNKGVNSFLQGIREEIARHNGYTMLMCTTTGDNLHEIHILEKYGWKLADSFNNKRTTNDVLVYTKTLQ
jgi:hypothetical protein